MLWLAGPNGLLLDDREEGKICLMEDGVRNWLCNAPNLWRNTVSYEG